MSPAALLPDLPGLVVERVTLTTHTEGKVIRAEIGWQGGATSHVEVPKYLFSARNSSIELPN